MWSWRRGFQWSAWVAGALLLAATAGCATGAAVPERVLGSPDHHVENGLKLMEKGRLDAAHREFRMALDLDPRYAPAHRGDALVYAIRLDFDSAFKACHRAIHYTSREEIHNLSRDVFDRFDSFRWDRRSWRRDSARGKTTCLARLFVMEFLNEYYKLGLAFKFGGDHDAHEEVLERALAFTDAFSEKASFHLKAGRTLQEMIPETELARGVAFLDSVSRAEAAALLVQEIGLKDHLDQPVGEPVCPAEGQARPTDLNEHPLKDDICVVLALGIDGFDSFEDRSFLPDSPMHRAEYAAAVADILGRLDLDGTLLRQGTRSTPFDDVPDSSPGFRAVEVCTELGIMKGEKGRFRPGVPLSGMDAVESIHRIKELLGAD